MMGLMAAPRKSRPMGRPREFDFNRALDCALQVFREKGYEGASLSDLTRAMGINRPSLYAAFGDKQALFQKALKRYIEGPASRLLAALEEPAARAAVERALHAAAELQTSPGSPPGCLTVQGAMTCSQTRQPVQQELVDRRKEFQDALRRRLRRARSEGDLPRQSSPADLARYFATIVNGMAVQASSGATRAELHRTIETAMRAWPGS